MAHSTLTAYRTDHERKLCLAAISRASISILCECLINANPDLLPRRHRAREEVRLDEFLRDIQSHVDLRVLGLAGNIQRIGGG